MSVAAGVLVYYKNSVLLAKRVETWEGEEVPFGGYWSIFAGSIEANESPIDCAKRELEEEAQIIGKNFQYITTLHREFTQLHIYSLELKRQETPVINAEHTDFAWFDISTIDSNPSPMDENLKNCIKNFKKLCNN